MSEQIDPAAFVAAMAPGDVAKAASEAYRTDFGYFAKRAMMHLNGPIDWNWHLDALCAWAQEIAFGDRRFSMVNVPPRTMKSMIFSSILPAYLMGQDPSAKIICVAHSQPLADKFAADTRRIIDSSWYPAAFPRTQLTKRALNELRTSAGGFRIATSIGGGITGRGGDFIIVDDPLKAEEAESDTARNNTIDWINATLHSRLNDQRKGSMVVVAQRLHQDDVCGRLLEQGDWKVLSIPAIAPCDETYDVGYGREHHRREGDLLHPEREPLEALQRLRAALGERRYEAQYQQSPVPADGAFFKRAWLRHDAASVLTRAGDRIVQSWDAASKTGERNDYSVCVTAIVRRAEIIVIDVFRAKLDFPGLKKAVIDRARRFKPAKLLIEDAAAGTQLIQMLRAEQPRGMQLPIPVKAVTSKHERAMVAAARCEAGALILPVSAPWLGDFVNELMSFPVGRHDDQVDALAHLMTHTQSGGLRRFAPPPAEAPADPDIMHQQLWRR